jgi:hypothetical protein
MLAHLKKLGSTSKDFQFKFKFKFSDSFLGPCELSALSGSQTRNLLSVNSILANPVMQCSSTNSKFISSSE